MSVFWELSVRLQMKDFIICMKNVDYTIIKSFISSRILKLSKTAVIIDFSNLPHDTSTAKNIIDFCSQGQRSPASKLYIVEKPHKHTHQELVPLYTRIFFRIETLHTYQELNTQHKHIYKTTLLHIIKMRPNQSIFKNRSVWATIKPINYICIHASFF